MYGHDTTCVVFQRSTDVGSSTEAEAEAEAQTGVLMTPKQSRFVAEYLIDLNATKAAERAGYSKKCAEKQGSENLGKPEIRAAIDAALARRAERTEMSADDVVRELIGLARSDIASAFAPDGSLLPIHAIPAAARRAIAAVEVRTDDDGAVITKLKWWDKTRGLEMLGRHLGMWVDRTKIEVSEGLADLLKAARAPAPKETPKLWPTDVPERVVPSPSPESVPSVKPLTEAAPAFHATTLVPAWEPLGLEQGIAFRARAPQAPVDPDAPPEPPAPGATEEDE